MEKHKTDPISLMKMWLYMGELTNQTRKEKLAYKELIIFSTHGIIKPEDWEGLSFEEREKRIELLTKEL